MAYSPLHTSFYIYKFQPFYILADIIKNTDGGNRLSITLAPLTNMPTWLVFLVIRLAGELAPCDE